MARARRPEPVPREAAPVRNAPRAGARRGNGADRPRPRTRMPGPSPWLALLALTSAMIASAGLMWAEVRSRPGNAQEGSLPGLTLDKAAAPEHGLVVTSVQGGSEARLRGIEVGDEILAINGIPAKPGKRAGQYLTRAAGSGLNLTLLHEGHLRRILLHSTKDHADGSENPPRRG